MMFHFFFLVGAVAAKPMLFYTDLTNTSTEAVDLTSNLRGGTVKREIVNATADNFTEDGVMLNAGSWSQCNEACFFKGETHTCRDRVNWLVGQGQHTGQAIDTVNSECRGQCSCSWADFASPTPPPTPDTQCANGNMYQDCGYWGITRSECEARGCCYTEHIGPKQKKCYPRGSNPTPPPTPHYRIFSGYECKDGYDAIPTPGECNEAAKAVQHTRLTVNTNVPSASVNPHGCYLYGSFAQGFSNLYFNYAGKTSGSWEDRNVICKIGA
jgi:hypothetical protein